MAQSSNTFWVYEDYQGVHHIVDSLDKVPPSLQKNAQSVEVTPEEAEALIQAQPYSDELQGLSALELDNGGKYADKLPPGVNADTMAGAGIFCSHSYFCEDWRCITVTRLLLKSHPSQFSPWPLEWCGPWQVLS